MCCFSLILKYTNLCEIEKWLLLSSLGAEIGVLGRPLEKLIAALKDKKEP